MLARLTILGIEKELNLQSPADSLKSKWVFTDQDVTFSADTLLATLINRAASFCVLYPDPAYFQLMNEAWFKRWEPAFTKWFKALSMEYNPIENYDRFESWTDTGESGSEVSSSGTTEGQVSAFDSSSYSPHDKEIQSSGSEASANNTDEHEGRIHGNIGVTTSQQMLESEMVLQEKWGNLYNHIADCFISELLVAVY